MNKKIQLGIFVNLSLHSHCIVLGSIMADFGNNLIDCYKIPIIGYRYIIFEWYICIIYCKDTVIKLVRQGI